MTAKPRFSIKSATWNPARPSKVISDFLTFPSIDPEAEKVASEVLADIRKNGDAAVVRYVKKFDRATLKPAGFRISEAEIAEARKTVDADFKRNAKEAAKRITLFAKAGLRKDWIMKTPCGGRLGEKYVPLDRVGVYIPGGTAPLASTSLMTACLARAAGVPEIVAVSPAGPDGRVNPYIIYALDLAGVTEMYRIGGIQAIGALAYGTQTIRKVQKIVGPGNHYVAAAKKLVYGQVALDSVAGPSEIAILADSSAPARFVAADMLSQAEHGSGMEKSLLVTTSRKLATDVEKELWKQAASLSRSDMVYKVLKSGTLIVTVKNLAEGVEIINRFAPEHLELLVKNPRTLLKKITAAGAIFVGPWTPESAGDFAAGPSHVLPTGGAAAMFSGLTVDDFRRRSSIIELTRKDLSEVLPVIEAFGRVEGLDAHVRSAQVRFE
ncbi:MAG: histidinol dehydrogenase [Candidatus Omnitrophota bacterium]|jgi:histidinol dehydrogenase